MEKYFNFKTIFAISHIIFITLFLIAGIKCFFWAIYGPPKNKKGRKNLFFNLSPF
jgi:hypothetical protein